MQDLVKQETDRIYNRFLNSVTGKVLKRFGLQNTEQCSPYMSVIDKEIQEFLLHENNRRSQRTHYQG